MDRGAREAVRVGGEGAEPVGGVGEDGHGTRRGVAAGRACDLVVALLAAGVVAYGVQVTGDAYFSSDEWALLDQAGDLAGILDQYNQHLSIVILATYRALVELFGFAYLPFQAAGLAWLVAVPVAWYLVARGCLGPPLAAAGALGLLAFDGLDVYAGQQNHFQALVGGIVCAWALERGHRADWLVAASLAFSLASAGGGVAVAAAAAVHSLLTRARLRRWVAVLAPAAAWGAWWLLVPDQGDGVPAGSLGDDVRFVLELWWNAARSLAGGVPALGAVLVAGFAVAAALTLRRGLVASANLLAWSAAAVVWSVGLSRHRGVFESPDSFRYEYVAAAFFLLALVPRRALSWWAPVAGRRAAVGAAGAVVAGGLVAGVLARHDLAESARLAATIGGATRGTSMVFGARPEVVPDDQRGTFYLGLRTAATVREMFDRYDPDRRIDREELDRRLVEEGLVRARVRGRVLERCEPLDGTVTVPTGGTAVLDLLEPDATVAVRRFGEAWATVPTPRAARRVTVVLPRFGVDGEWELRAEDACLVRVR